MGWLVHMHVAVDVQDGRLAIVGTVQWALVASGNPALPGAKAAVSRTPMRCPAELARHAVRILPLGVRLAIRRAVEVSLMRRVEGL